MAVKLLMITASTHKEKFHAASPTDIVRRRGAFQITSSTGIRPHIRQRKRRQKSTPSISQRSTRANDAATAI